MRVVEYTSRNTGSSLAFACAVKGYPQEIVPSDAFAQEKRQTMVTFGAHFTLILNVNCQITPDLTPWMIYTAQAIANQPGILFNNQLHSSDLVKSYEKLNRGLLAQVEGSIHAFCG